MAERRTAEAPRSTEALAARGWVALSGRALLIGTITVAVSSFLVVYLGIVTRTWNPGGNALPTTGVVVLFLLVALNGLLARITPRSALRRVELLVTYAMVIMTTQFLCKGGMPFIISMATYPFYAATGANDWEHRLCPYIPLPLRVSDLSAATWFYEGLPAGTAIPWRAWASPLLAWGSFSFAMMAAMFCLGALLSRDWIERQRLAFPLAEIPLAITGDTDTPTLGGSLLRNRLAWIGFAIPTLVGTANWLHALYPSVPEIPWQFDIGRAVFSGKSLPWSVLAYSWTGVHAWVQFALIGIAYLMPGEVSLSLWLFYVLYRVQQLVWASFGVAPGVATGANIDPRSFIAMQETGGFIMLAAVLLYQSRHTLAEAWRGLIRPRSPASEDPAASLPPRWALLGFLMANAFLLWWVAYMGMPWWPFVLVMALFYAVMMGISRLVAAAGLTHVDPGIGAPDAVLSTLGAGAIGPRGLSMYGYLGLTFMNDARIVLMAQAMNSFKLLHTSRVKARRFSVAAALAVGVMLLAGFAAMLVCVYPRGVMALPEGPLYATPQWYWQHLDDSLRAPGLPNPWYYAALVIGAVVMGGLIALHSASVWWPVSPIGFLIASGWSTDVFVWSNTFAGWLIATLVRRYGGLRLYRTLRPLFVGLVLGQYVPPIFFAVTSALMGVVQPW